MSMGLLVVPLLLVVLVCVPLTVLGTWLLLASSIGQRFGAPPRGDLRYVEYARLLLGRPPHPITEDAWAPFTALLSEVAAGHVGPWDRLGGSVAPPRPAPSEPAWPPITRPAPSTGWTRARIIVGVIVALVFMLAMSALARVANGPAQPNAASSFAAQVYPSAQWMPTGPAVARTAISPGEAVLFAQALARAGFDDGCSDLTAAAATDAAAAQNGRPSALALVCEASSGTGTVQVFSASSPMLQIQVSVPLPL